MASDKTPDWLVKYRVAQQEAVEKAERRLGNWQPDVKVVDRPNGNKAFRLKTADVAAIPKALDQQVKYYYEGTNREISASVVEALRERSRGVIQRAAYESPTLDTDAMAEWERNQRKLRRRDWPGTAADTWVKQQERAYEAEQRKLGIYPAGYAELYQANPDTVGDVFGLPSVSQHPDWQYDELIRAKREAQMSSTGGKAFGLLLQTVSTIGLASLAKPALVFTAGLTGVGGLAAAAPAVGTTLLIAASAASMYMAYKTFFGKDQEGFGTSDWFNKLDETLDWGVHKVEQGLGFGLQLAGAQFGKNEEFGTVQEILNNPKAAAEAGKILFETIPQSEAGIFGTWLYGGFVARNWKYKLLSLGLTAGLGVTGSELPKQWFKQGTAMDELVEGLYPEDWVRHNWQKDRVWSPDEKAWVESPGAGWQVLVDYDLPSQSAWATALTEFRRRVMAGEDPAEITQEYVRGAPAQIREFAGMLSPLDPLEKMGDMSMSLTRIGFKGTRALRNAGIPLPGKIRGMDRATYDKKFDLQLQAVETAADAGQTLDDAFHIYRDLLANTTPQRVGRSQALELSTFEKMLVGMDIVRAAEGKTTGNRWYNKMPFKLATLTPGSNARDAVIRAEQQIGKYIDDAIPINSEDPTAFAHMSKRELDNLANASLEQSADTPQAAAAYNTINGRILQRVLAHNIVAEGVDRRALARELGVENVDDIPRTVDELYTDFVAHEPGHRLIRDIAAAITTDKKVKNDRGEMVPALKYDDVSVRNALIKDQASRDAILREYREATQVVDPANGEVQSEWQPETWLDGYIEHISDTKNPFSADSYRTIQKDIMLNQAASWGIDTFGVKELGFGWMVSQTLKTWSSIFLLGTNPAYLLNNVWNNLFTMPARGLYGRFVDQISRTRDLQKRMAAYGEPPVRFAQGIGFGGDHTAGAEAGLEGGVAQAMSLILTAEKPTGKGLRGLLLTGLQGTEKVGKTIGQKIGLFSHLAAAAEQQQSAYAMLSAYEEMWAVMHRIGGGIDPIPVTLEQTLGRERMKMLYAQILQTKNPVKLGKVITEALTVQYDRHAIAVDEARGLPPGTTLRLLQHIGIGEAVNEALRGLPQDASVESIDAIFETLKQEAEDGILEQLRNQTNLDSEHAQFVLENEGPGGLIRLLTNLDMSRGATHVAHMQNLREAWSRINQAGPIERQYLIAQMFTQADRNWEQFRQRAQIFIDSIADNLSSLGLGPYATNLQASFTRQQDATIAFNERRRAIQSDFFSRRGGDYQAEVLEPINEAYAEWVRVDQAQQEAIDNFLIEAIRVHTGNDVYADAVANLRRAQSEYQKRDKDLVTEFWQQQSRVQAGELSAGDVQTHAELANARRLNWKEALDAENEGMQTVIDLYHGTPPEAPEGPFQPFEGPEGPTEAPEGPAAPPEAAEPTVEPEVAEPFTPVQQDVVDDARMEAAAEDLTLGTVEHAEKLDDIAEEYGFEMAKARAPRAAFLAALDVVNEYRAGQGQPPYAVIENVPVQVFREAMAYHKNNQQAEAQQVMEVRDVVKARLLEWGKGGEETFAQQLTVEQAELVFGLMDARAEVWAKEQIRERGVGELGEVINEWWRETIHIGPTGDPDSIGFARTTDELAQMVLAGRMPAGFVHKTSRTPFSVVAGFAPDADFPTFIHEVAHVLRHQLDPTLEVASKEYLDGEVARIRSKYEANDELDEYEQVLVTKLLSRPEIVGEDGRLTGEAFETLLDTTDWTYAAEELFAQQFERYIEDGVAPTPVLTQLFQKMKQVLLAFIKRMDNITQFLRGLGREGTYRVGGAPEVISPELKAVFDRLLAENPDIEGVFGDNGQAFGPNMTPIDYQYVVVDLDNVTASHDFNTFVPNAEYNAIQPRDRERFGNIHQFNSIYQQFVPEGMIRGGDQIDSGSPFIDRMGNVESGNLRTMVLKRLASEGDPRYDDYSQQVAEFMDTGGIERPMLVRVRTDPSDQAEFVRLANIPKGIPMTDAENAVSDAALMRDTMFDLLDVGEGTTFYDAVRQTQNQGFVRSFMQTLAPQEQAAMLDADGNLSKAGVDRVTAATLAYVFGPELGGELAHVMFEATDINVRNAANGVLAASGHLARSEGLIRQGAREANLSLAPDLGAALVKLQTIKSKGTPGGVELYLQQSQMFGEELSPLGKIILTDLNNMMRSGKAVRERLQDYSRRVQQQPHPSQNAMPGFEGGAEANAQILWEQSGQADAIQTMFVEPSVAPIAQRDLPKLPANLKRATPRYGYQTKQYELQFESDVDLALYIVTSKRKSAQHEGYSQWLQNIGFYVPVPEYRGGPTIGKVEPQAAWKDLRNRIKEQARVGDPAEGPLVITASPSDLMPINYTLETIAPDPTPNIITLAGDAPLWESRALRIVDNATQRSMPAQDWINWLGKQPQNIKKQEIEQLELEAFLEGKGNVSKVELAEYIAENQLRIDEKRLGGLGRGVDVEAANVARAELIADDAYSTLEWKYLSQYVWNSPYPEEAFRAVENFVRMTMPQVDTSQWDINEPPRIYIPFGGTGYQRGVAELPTEYDMFAGPLRQALADVPVEHIGDTQYMKDAVLGAFEFHAQQYPNIGAEPAQYEEYNLLPGDYDNYTEILLSAPNAKGWGEGQSVYKGTEHFPGAIAPNTIGWVRKTERISPTLTHGIDLTLRSEFTGETKWEYQKIEEPEGLTSEERIADVWSEALAVEASSWPAYWRNRPLLKIDVGSIYHVKNTRSGNKGPALPSREAAEVWLEENTGKSDYLVIEETKGEFTAEHFENEANVHQALEQTPNEVWNREPDRSYGARTVRDYANKVEGLNEVWSVVQDVADGKIDVQDFKVYWLRTGDDKYRVRASMQPGLYLKEMRQGIEVTAQKAGLSLGDYGPTASDAQKTIHIEEVQSDWMQGAVKARLIKAQQVAKNQNISLAEAKKLVPSDWGYYTPRAVGEIVEMTYQELLDTGWHELGPDALPHEIEVAREELRSPTDDTWDYTIREVVRVVLDTAGDPITYEFDSRISDDYDVSTNRDTMYDLYEIEVAREELRSPTNAALSNRARALLEHEVIQAQEADMVPDSPMRLHWGPKFVQRMIQDAARQGIGTVSWTNGETVAEMNNVTRVIDAIQYRSPDDETYYMRLHQTNGGWMTTVRGLPYDLSKGVTLEQMQDFLPFELTETIRNREGGDRIPYEYELTDLATTDLVAPYEYELGVDDLTVSGQGMINFYNRELVKGVNKWLKPFDVKVEQAKLEETDVWSVAVKPEMGGPLATYQLPKTSAHQELFEIMGRQRAEIREGLGPKPNHYKVVKAVELMNKQQIIDAGFEDGVIGHNTKLFGPNKNAKALDVIAEGMYNDVVYSIGVEQSRGRDFYDKAYDAALKELGRAIPDLKAGGQLGRDARNVITLFLAVTSDGRSPTDQMHPTQLLYESFKAFNRFDGDVDYGLKKAELNNLKRLQAIYEAFGSMDEVTAYLRQSVRVGDAVDLKGMKLKQKSLLVDAVVPLAAMYMGPKLGNFYANLSGDQQYATLDRWAMRSYNRQRGDVMGVASKASLDTYRQLHKTEATDGEILNIVERAADESNMLHSYNNRPQSPLFKQNYPKSADKGMVTQLENLVGWRRSSQGYGRGRPGPKGTAKFKADALRAYLVLDKRRTATGDAFQRLWMEHTMELNVKNIYKAAFEKSLDAPRTGTERENVLKSYREVQRLLKERGHGDHTVAQIQAMLWRYEKVLYKAVGAPDSGTGTYLEAVQKHVENQTSTEGKERRPIGGLERPIVGPGSKEAREVRSERVSRARDEDAGAEEFNRPEILTQLRPSDGLEGDVINLPDGRQVIILGRTADGIMVRFLNEAEPRVVTPGDYDYSFLPPGVIERATEGGPQPIGDANLQLHNEEILPMLRELQERLKDDVRRYGGTRMDISSEFENLSESDTRDLNQYLAQQRQNMVQNKLMAEKYAEAKRDSALLNYSRRYHYNHYLGMIFPYEFWATQSMMRWAHHSLDRPMWLAGLHRAKQFLNEQVEKPGMPSRLQGRLKIPLAFLPDWLESAGGGAPDGIWLDPLQIGLPIERFAYPFEEYAMRQGQIEGKTNRELETMLADGDISQAEYSRATTEQSGDVWDRAQQKAEDKDVNLRYDYADFALSLLGPHVPLMNAYQFARGTPERIYPLPITRHTRALSTMLGIGGPSGINLEAGIREKLDMPVFDQWEDYRIDRALSDMVAEGEITVDEARISMIERNDEIFLRAQEHSARQTAWGVAGSWMFGASGQVFPEGEHKQRINKLLMRAALDAQDKGDTEAMNKFFEQHPEYKARMALWDDDPEARMRNFLIDKLWNDLYLLPKLHKKQAMEVLGDGFNKGFLQKPEDGAKRDYDAIPTETLAMWAKTLGVYIPDFGDHRAVPALPIEYAPADVAEQYEQYIRLREDIIGDGDTDFWDRQSEYFELRDMKVMDPKSLATAALLEDLGDGDFDDVEQAYFDIPAVQDRRAMMDLFWPNAEELWKQYHNIPKNSRVTISTSPPTELDDNYRIYYAEQNQMFPEIGKVYDEYYDMPAVKNYYATRDHHWPNYVEDNAQYRELRDGLHDWRESKFTGAGALEEMYYAIKNGGGSREELAQFRQDNPVLGQYWDEKYKDDSPYANLKAFREDKGLIQAWQFGDNWEQKHPEKGEYEFKHPEMQEHREWKNAWRIRSPELMAFLEENPRRQRSERSLFYQKNLKEMVSAQDQFDANHPEIEEFHEANPHLKEGWELERNWEEENPELAKTVAEATDASDEFLLDNPDIVDYWALRQYFKENYPDLLPFITSQQATDDAVGEGEEGENFLASNPALQRMFIAGIIGGGFNDVTMKALQGEWRLADTEEPFEFWLAARMGQGVSPAGAEIVH